MLIIIRNLIFKCNTDVTRLVFIAIFIIPIFPVLAESGAGGGAGAPHGWLTATYTDTLHPPATILQAVEVAGITSVPEPCTVHGAAHVLLLSVPVVTQVL